MSKSTGYAAVVKMWNALQGEWEEIGSMILQHDYSVKAVSGNDRPAEYLLSLWEMMRKAQGIMEVSGELDHAALAQFRLALRFAKLPDAVRFAAMVECWSLEQIIRECY